MKAVLFDFGGVITEPMTAMFEAIAADAGAPAAEVAALLLGAYEIEDHPFNRLELGEATFAELCDWARAQGASRGWRLELAPMIALMDTIPVRPAVSGWVRSWRYWFSLDRAMVASDASIIAPTPSSTRILSRMRRWISRTWRTTTSSTRASLSGK